MITHLNSTSSIHRGISETSRKIDRLTLRIPDYLTDVHIYFHEIDDRTKQRLQRFVYTYVSLLPQSIIEVLVLL